MTSLKTSWDRFFYSWLVVIRVSFVVCVFAPLLSSSVFAQQGRGLFFSTFGVDASLSYGDFNNVQAFYFDIPTDETKPVHLRVFDPDISGLYDEAVGAFNTETRFLVLGGVSASKIYGGQLERSQPKLDFDTRDVILDRIFNNSGAGNGRWYTLLELKKEKGYPLENGFVRFVLLVIGGKGNDGNYYDLALSHSATEKIEPKRVRSFVYDLSLRIPNIKAYGWNQFKGRIKLQTPNVSELRVATFDMDNMPISLTVPFKGEIPLVSSADAQWVETPVNLRQFGNVTEVQFNFYGNEINNTVGLHFRDQENLLIPIELPITDYEEPNYPILAYKTYYSGDDCNGIVFETLATNDSLLTELETHWIFDDEVLTGNRVEKTFFGVGYRFFTWKVRASVENHTQEFFITDSVVVNTPPVAIAGGNRWNIANNYMAFDATASFDRDGFIKKYVWDFGDGTQAEGARVDKKYDKPGLYTVKVTVFDDSGSLCGSDDDSVLVRINLPPQAKIVAPYVVQPGEVFALDASNSQDPDGNVIEYLWQVGNDTLLQGPVVYYAFNDFDTRKITLQVLDEARTYNSKNRANTFIRVNRLPLASAGTNKIVSPNRIATFNGSNSRDPDGKLIDYEWIFPNGITKSGNVVTHAFDTPGTFTVYLKVTDDTQKGVGIDSLQVTVNAPPVSVIKGDLVFNSGRVMLDGTESFDPDGEITDQFWIIGNTTIKSPVLNYGFQSPGKYTVTHTVVDNSGTYSAIQSNKFTVTINDLPVPVIDAPKVVAPGMEVVFSGQRSTDSDGQIIRYVWDLGDGTQRMGETVSHVYREPGRYQYSLTVEDDLGGPGSAVIKNAEITVNAPPVLKYNFPKRIVSGSEVWLDLSPSYDSDGTITEYLYKVGDVFTPGESKQAFVLSGMVTQLTVAVRDNADLPNSEVTAVIPVAINQAPVAVVANKKVRTATPLVYFDGTKSYDSDGDELTYYWSFGDGSFSEGAMAFHKYKYGGTYHAVLTVDDQQGLSNSQSSDTVTVFVNRSPEVYIDLPEMICQSDVIIYDASKSYDPDEAELTYFWNFGDGGSSDIAKGTYKFQNEGVYQVVLTVNDNEGLPNSITRLAQTVTVIGAPQAYAGEDFTACEGEFVSFDASGSSTGDPFNTEYRWDFGNGTVEEGSKVSTTFDKPGVYKVKLTLSVETIGSCTNKATDEVIVTVIPKPKADFSIPSIVRTGEAITFDPTPSLVPGVQLKTLTWKIGQSETITYSRVRNSVKETRWIVKTSAVEGESELPDESAKGKLPSFNRILEEGDYTITLMVETEGGSACTLAEQTRYVTVQEKPILDIQDIPVLVPNVPFQFSGSRNTGDQKVIRSAYWNMGDGTEKQGLFVTHAYTKPGTYKVELLADDGSGGPSAITRTQKSVVVNAPPKALLEGPERALSGEKLTFTATQSSDPDGEIIAYTWFISDGTRLQGKRITHSFKKAGTFTVTLTVQDNSKAANALSSISKTVRISELRDVSINLPSVICVGSELGLFDALSFPVNDSSKIQVYIGTKKLYFNEAKNLTFNFAGNYAIRVMYTPSLGETTTALKHNLLVNGPPEIIAEVPESISIGALNEYATFDASKSFDPNNDLVRVEWDFGDGKIAFGKKVQHLYSRPGTYKVRLTIIDDKGTDCSTVQKVFEVNVVRN